MNRPLTLSRRKLIAGAVSNVMPGLTRVRDGGSFAGVVAPAATPNAPAWTPGQGLRLAGSPQPNVSLDPALSRDLPTNMLIRQLFRGLTRFDSRLNVVPELAESIDVSPDGFHYDVVLRAASRFHDGRSVEAADVHESLSRALRPGTGGGLVQSLAGVTYLRDIAGAEEVMSGQATNLSGVAIHDARNLTITINEPSATFLMKLASVPSSIVDRFQVESDPDWTLHPNGSGPFRCDHFAQGRELVLGRSPDWWAGSPAVPTVTIRLGPAASQPLNLFFAGEIDIADGIPPDQSDLLRDPASEMAGATLVETPLFAVSYIALGNSEPPLGDIHIRRALTLAFPSDRIATSMFNGAVTPATGLIPDGMLQSTWEIERATPDLASARREVAASRYGAPSTVPAIRIYAADIAPVEALRDTAGRDLGLDIQAIAVSWPDLLNGLAERAFPAYSLYWGADYPDPESLLWMLFGSDSPENYTGYRNDPFDAELAWARAEPDVTARIASYRQAQTLLIEDAAVIPLYFDTGYTIVRDGISGLDVTPMGILGLETLRAAI